MPINLTNAQRAALLGFLGYGNPRADIVFLGMEEGLVADPSYPLGAQLIDRAKLSNIVDLHAVTVRHDKFLSGETPRIQPTWSVLIRALFAFRGRAMPTRDEVRDYQRHRLGVTDGETLLVELLPLPAPSVGSWPYKDYFSEFPDRPAYLKSLLEHRKSLVADALSYRPRFVLAYGMTYWEYYRAVFERVKKWNTYNGAFSFAVDGTTAIVLMPHPVSRAMNGRRGALFDLARTLGTGK